MEKILDPSDFDDGMAIMREHAAALPRAQGELIGLLGKLIEDALAEFAGEKFVMPRRMGDLADADGIRHLLDDYPPQVPPGKFFRVAFLSTNEEAAAHYLLKLYLARDFLRMGFGLSEESIREIEATGNALNKLRLWGPAFQHENDKAKQSRLQSKRARPGQPRKRTAVISGRTVAVTKAELEKYRDQFIYDRGRERGWRTAACAEFGITFKTLVKRMEE
jgi:hypothetical protein